MLMPNSRRVPGVDLRAPRSSARSRCRSTTASASRELAHVIADAAAARAARRRRRRRAQLRRDARGGAARPRGSGPARAGARRCARAAPRVIDLGDARGRRGDARRRRARRVRSARRAGEVEALQALVSVRDRAMIIYTSGTTAKPKGCVLNHEGLTRTAFAVAQERFLLGTEDRFWDPLPFCHLSSLVILHACLAAGATFVSTPRFEAGAGARPARAERCTFAYPCFDTITAALQDHPDFEPTDLSALRLVVNDRRARAAARAGRSAGRTRPARRVRRDRVLRRALLQPPRRPLDRASHTCGPPIPGMEIRVVDPETGEDAARRRARRAARARLRRVRGLLPRPRAERARDRRATAGCAPATCLRRRRRLRRLPRPAQGHAQGRRRERRGGRDRGRAAHPPDVREAQVVAAPDAQVRRGAGGVPRAARRARR